MLVVQLLPYLDQIASTKALYGEPCFNLVLSKVNNTNTDYIRQVQVMNIDNLRLMKFIYEKFNENNYKCNLKYHCKKHITGLGHLQILCRYS